MVFLHQFEVTPLDREIDTLTTASNSMAKIVLDTIQNGAHNFVSSLDHLPCDIVRCLWLIQSLELKNIRLKQRLFKVFDSTPDSVYSNEQINEINHLNSIINRNLLEIKTETSYLIDLLDAHIKLINDEQHLSDLLKEKLKNWTSEKVESQWKEWCIFKSKVIANDPNRSKKSLEIPGLKIRIRLKSSSSEPLSPPSNSHKKRSSTENSDKLQINKKPHLEQTPVVQPKPKVVLEKPKIYSDEPVYCTCNGPATGRMIGCENTKCPRGEWFHFKCIGITKEPETKWFCSKDCEDTINKPKPKHQKKKRRNW